jgi:cytochrome c peroxidase
MRRKTRGALAAAIWTVGLAACSQHVVAPPVPEEVERRSHTGLLPLPPDDPDVQRSNAEIDAAFGAARAQLAQAASLDVVTQLTLLGKLGFFDRDLSVERNQACASCHLPSAGFSGGVSTFNHTSVAYPGSVERFGGRRPQTAGYAPFAPIFHWDPSQVDFFGGNFWDMRATGARLGNPASEQAAGPPTNALEMGLADPACVVLRVSRSSYRSLFELVWGAQSFAIHWPADTDAICEKPAVEGGAPFVLDLDAADRATASSTYDRLSLAIATYEGSSEVSAFSSKLDLVLAGQATLLPNEQNGWALFHGKANCDQCHLDGTAPGTQPADIIRPLFTDFSSANIGIPANPNMPNYDPTKPDRGVGEFLRTVVEWAPQAPAYMGRFRVPTLRNADKRPRADFIKSYMHNGYLTSLKEVVHFYNTSQALPHCPHGSPDEKLRCWPPPEVADNLNSNLVGNLQLSDSEEDDLVAFLRTLSDGYGH